MADLNFVKSPEERPIPGSDVLGLWIYKNGSPEWQISWYSADNQRWEHSGDTSGLPGQLALWIRIPNPAAFVVSARIQEADAQQSGLSQEFLDCLNSSPEEQLIGPCLKEFHRLAETAPEGKRAVYSKYMFSPELPLLRDHKQSLPVD